MNAFLAWLVGLFRSRPTAAPPHNPQEMSGTGRRWLGGWEEYRERPYLDAGGVWTWGIGHAETPGEPAPVFITYDEALALFAADLRPREAAVREAVTVAVLQHEFDALVAFVFNVGAGAFRTSTLLRKLNAGDRAGCVSEFGRWIHAGGKVVPGLVRRRQAESDVFTRAAYWGP